MDTYLLKNPFTIEELQKGINYMKTGNRLGWTRYWLTNTLAQRQNYCTYTFTASVGLLIKSQKNDPEVSNSYPISLSCHQFKLYERLIVDRIQGHLEPKLILQQAGFRLGKSCTGQVLNITEFIRRAARDNKGGSVRSHGCIWKHQS